jgi:hypothetical protein
MALIVGWQVPFNRTDNHELGEEMVASFLYQAQLYHWLETEGRSISRRRRPLKIAGAAPNLVGHMEIRPCGHASSTYSSRTFG